MSKRLDNDRIFKLINLYRSHAGLWDKKSNLYRRRDLNTKAYQKIADEMGMSPDAVKEKLRNLRVTYTAERSKLLSKNSGEDKNYIPTLAWFGEMHFLDDYITKRPIVKVLNVKNNKNVIIDQNEYDQKDNAKDIVSQNDCEEDRLSDNFSPCENPVSFLSLQESKENKCRICLEEDIELDWNDIMYGHSNMTYKNCFYKYSQLEYFEGDDFPNMLCRNCSNGLEYIDTFISKAIEAHVILQEKKHCFNVISEDDIKQGASNFEEILVEQIEIKSEIESSNEVCIEEFISATPEEETYSLSKRCSTPLTPQRTERNHRKAKTVKKTVQLKQSRDRLTKIASLVENKQRPKRIEESICCSYCPKVLASRYKAVQHEKVHEKRERNVTCMECGLKFYNKETLKLHMPIHKNNREKPHKCEFCEKTFFHKGALNVHLRIHLGQMIPCSLCTKKFFRQIDLDRHMAGHSASKINSDIQIRKKYFVRCKDCGENVRSINFKKHSAKHMNEPLFKCALCNKGFFTRKSCTTHLIKTHKIMKEETQNHIISQRKNRISHLFLEQYSNGEISHQSIE